MSDHYILEGHTPVIRDLLTWGAWMQTADTTVARTVLGDGQVVIHTAFLGLDFNLNVEGDPHFFETNVSAPDYPEIHYERERAGTWDAALACHERIVTVAEAATGLVRS